ncbi:hypothetical protein GALMADRAFT_139833 [Galerina marginata CBS 339.88]|uniref:Uncharacterized protein n=1 Tax=Galerina marginata (strain CBS 339.88) TaxID=685588 RepID=A0A067TAQ3_GALM3|nr:hypothetical protein GALMADRAFT_139833 [Galerina marginata CBS 339.88]
MDDGGGRPVPGANGRARGWAVEEHEGRRIRVQLFVSVASWANGECGGVKNHGTGDPPAVTLLFLRLPPPPVAPVAYTHARPALFVTALFVVLASLAVHAVAWTLLAFVVVTTVPATVDECATRAAAGVTAVRDVLDNNEPPGPFEATNHIDHRRRRKPDQPPSTLVDLAFHHHLRPPFSPSWPVPSLKTSRPRLVFYCTKKIVPHVASPPSRRGLWADVPTNSGGNREKDNEGRPWRGRPARPTAHSRRDRLVRSPLPLPMSITTPPMIPPPQAAIAFCVHKIPEASRAAAVVLLLL